jgi:hypothetical protein
MMLIT